MNELSRNKPCPHCGRFANRGVSVDAIILKGEEILLVKRGVEPQKGFWATPGGYVEWDESAEDAVRREVREETGLEVDSLEMLDVYSEPDRHPKQVINILYKAGVEPGELKAGDDSEEVRWFKLNALPEEMALDHKQNIADAKILLGLTE